MRTSLISTSSPLAFAIRELARNQPTTVLGELTLHFLPKSAKFFFKVSLPVEETVNRLLILRIRGILDFEEAEVDGADTGARRCLKIQIYYGWLLQTL